MARINRNYAYETVAKAQLALRDNLLVTRATGIDWYQETIQKAVDCLIKKDFISATIWACRVLYWHVSDDETPRQITKDVYQYLGFKYSPNTSRA